MFNCLPSFDWVQSYHELVGFKLSLIVRHLKVWFECKCPVLMSWASASAPNYVVQLYYLVSSIGGQGLHAQYVSPIQAWVLLLQPGHGGYLQWVLNKFVRSSKIFGYAISTC